MWTDTPDRARRVHRPDEPVEGVVFAFDRDYTVDVNPPPDEGRAAVPLEWVGYLAHRTEHVVYATGNQLLKREAGIPGTADIVEAHPDAELPADDGTYAPPPGRRERVRLLGDLYPAADEYVVVDDVDLSDLDGWTYYPSWEFVPAARDGAVVDALPPSDADLAAVDVFPHGDAGDV